MFNGSLREFSCICLLSRVPFCSRFCRTRLESRPQLQRQSDSQSHSYRAAAAPIGSFSQRLPRSTLFHGVSPCSFQFFPQLPLVLQPAAHSEISSAKKYINVFMLPVQGTRKGVRGRGHTQGGEENHYSGDDDRERQRSIARFHERAIQQCQERDVLIASSRN